MLLGVADDAGGFVLVEVDILFLLDDHLLKHWLLWLPRMHRRGTLASLARGIGHKALGHLLGGTIAFIHVQDGLVVVVALILEGPLEKLIEGQRAHSDRTVFNGWVDQATRALVIGVVG